MNQQLLQQYENSPYPFLLATPELTVLWANNAAKAVLPAASHPDGLKISLPGSDPTDCAAQLKAGQTLLLSDPLLPGLLFKLTPVQNDEEGTVLVQLLNAVQPQLQPTRSNPTQALAAFSHTYRNPLSDIFGMLGVIGSHLHALMDDSCDTCLENISRDCYQMLRSFSNLSELYKFHSGVIAEADHQPVDIWQLTRSLCESAAMLLRSVDIPLTFDLPEEPCLVLCDQNRYATALSNLFANCSQFTRQGNAVHLTGKVVGSRAIVTVADRGCGIPEEHIGRVLEPFFSYDPNGAPFAGLGIGLPLAHSFVRSMGGSLALQSREMEGTVVSLSLPVYTGQLPPISCRDAALLLSDRFSPLQVVLGSIINK